MAQANTIDVSELIDERKMNAFNAQLVILSFFVATLDGYDIGAVAFAAPHLIKAWAVTDTSWLKWVIVASLAGILFGSPGFGYIGDRFGRKIAIIGSCLTFGVFTLAATAATSMPQLLMLRFFAGIGIGGLFPNIIAINAEFAPQRVRATMIILMFTGVTFGGALPGAVSAWVVPYYGWQILFVLGGVLPIAICLAVYLWMPESIKFLVLKAQARDVVVRLVQRLSPELAVGPDTRFVIREEKVQRFSLPLLFKGGLRYLTPLLWLLFVCNQMVFYVANSWMPTVLSTVNVSIGSAAIVTSLFQIGGTVGGVLLSLSLNKRGIAPVAVLFLASLPIVGSIGFSTGSVPLLMTLAFLAGFCLLGVQFGLNATSAMLYPTAFRSNGSGWAFGIGRFGSISGPLVWGYLIDMKLPLPELFLLLLIPLGIGTVASVVMARLYSVEGHAASLLQTETAGGVPAGE